MASFRQRGKIWFYRYTDEHGRQVEKKGYTGRRETEDLAKAVEREVLQIKAGLVDPKALAYREHEAKPLADHLTDYRGYLIGKGSLPRYANLTRNQITRLLDLARAKRVSDLAPSRVQSALKAIRDEGGSLSTVQHYLRSVKSFSRWLWRDGRAREDTLAPLVGKSSDLDLRRVRRALSADELARLISAAEHGRVVRSLTGPDRAALYRVAAGTGFRANELRSLTPESFDLDSDPPTVTVKAAYSKRRRNDVQPIRPDLAEALRPWLAARPAKKPVFGKLTKYTADLIRRDLEAAGVPYGDGSDRVADFHALRHTYITALVKSPTPVKVVQTLARHSTPTLTLGAYAHVGVYDLTAALDALPDQTPSTPSTEAAALRATGTGGGHINNRVALPLPYSVQGSGRIETDTDGSADVNRPEHDPVVMMREPRENKRADASSGFLTAIEGGHRERLSQAVGGDEEAVPLDGAGPPENGRHRRPGRRPQGHYRAGQTGYWADACAQGGRRRVRQAAPCDRDEGTDKGPHGDRRKHEGVPACCRPGNERRERRVRHRCVRRTQ
jgi:integrase